MKRKITFKNYQKLLFLILILVATLIFGFINGSSNVIEGNLYIKPPRDDNATESKHKDAANVRSEGDGDIRNSEANNYEFNTALNNNND